MPSHSSYVALPAAYAKVALCITDMADIQPRLQPKTRSCCLQPYVSLATCFNGHHPHNPRK